MNSKISILFVIFVFFCVLIPIQALPATIKDDNPCPVPAPPCDSNYHSIILIKYYCNLITLLIKIKWFIYLQEV
jgi:hypothetical protein